MAVAGDLLLDPLREAVGMRAIPSAAEDVEIVLGELGERAELLGAVALVLGEAGPAWAGPAPAIKTGTRHQPPRRTPCQKSEEIQPDRGDCRVGCRNGARRVR